jgi:hypothetical protein
VKVSYEGRDYEFDLLKVPTEELREIKRKLKMTPAKFLEGITEVDVDAMLALKWVVLRSDGQHDDLVLNPVDPFPDYWQFVQAWNDADEQEEEGEPDPTQAGSLPATSTPESSESSTPTLTSSPASTAIPSPGSAESVNGRSDGSPSELSSPTSSA